MEKIMLHFSNGETLILTEGQLIMGIRDNSYKTEAKNEIDEEYDHLFPFKNMCEVSLKVEQFDMDNGLFRFVFELLTNYDFIYLNEKRPFKAYQCSSVVKISEVKEKSPRDPAQQKAWSEVIKRI